MGVDNWWKREGLEIMTFEQVKAFYGTQYAAAVAIKVSPQVVSKWGKRGEIPLWAQVRWEVQSKGGVRADLPRFVRRRAA